MVNYCRITNKKDSSQIKLTVLSFDQKNITKVTVTNSNLNTRYCGGKYQLALKENIEKIAQYPPFE